MSESEFCWFHIASNYTTKETHRLHRIHLKGMAVIPFLCKIYLVNLYLPIFVTDILYVFASEVSLSIFLYFCMLLWIVALLADLTSPEDLPMCPAADQ